MNYLLILQSYWGIIVGIIIGIGYILTHRKIAYSYAKKEAISLLFIAEAHAEKFLLANSQAKIGFVVNTIYDNTPVGLKLILNKPILTFIVQTLYDKALAYAEAHQIKEPEITANPATVIISNAPAEVSSI